MKSILTKYYSLASLSVSMILFNSCHSEMKSENYQDRISNSDATKIVSFSIDRTKNADLNNWKKFEINDDVIFAPPGWNYKVDNTKFIMTPPNTLDENEIFVYEKLIKDGPTLDYEKLAQKIIDLDIDVQKRDTLKRIEFKNNFCFERNFIFTKNSTDYIGYFLIYVDENLIHEYKIILSKERINKYKGNLIKDIIGNLKINNKYIISSKNPIKGIDYIRDI